MHDLRQLYADAIIANRQLEKERNEIRATLATLAASLQKAAHEAGVPIKQGDSTLDLIPKLIEAVGASAYENGSKDNEIAMALSAPPKKKASAGDK